MNLINSVKNTMFPPEGNDERNSTKDTESDDGGRNAMNLPPTAAFQKQHFDKGAFKEREAEEMRYKIRSERVDQHTHHPVDEDEMDYDELEKYLSKPHTNRLIEYIQSIIKNVMTDEEVKQVNDALESMKTKKLDDTQFHRGLDDNAATTSSVNHHIPSQRVKTTNLSTQWARPDKSRVKSVEKIRKEIKDES